MRALAASLMLATAAGLISTSSASADDDPPYRTFARGQEAAWPTATRRMALLIGNDNYEAVGADGANPSAAPLTSLNNPCRDAQLVGTSLARIGWRKDEIAVLCNQSAEGVREALSGLFAATPSDPDEAKLVVVYLSGHGMQVNDKTYYFGVDARPDFVDAAKKVVHGEGRPIFTRDAVDVRGYITYLTGTRIQYPVLLVLDACRDNPIYDRIAQEYQAAYARRLAQRQADPSIPAPIVLNSSAPGAFGGTYPSGMLVAFASTAGATVEDDGGSGYGRLAEALAQKLEAEKVAQSLVFRALRHVENTTLNLPPARRQRPDSTGFLLQTETGEDWCFHGCAKPGLAAVAPNVDAGGNLRRASISGIRKTTLASNGKADAEQFRTALYDPPKSGKTPGKDRVEVLLDAKVPPEKTPYRLEVNWCDTDDSLSEERERLARAFGRAVAAAADARAATSDAQFGRIVLRRISESANAKPGQQINDTALFTKRGDPQEERLAAAATAVWNGRLHAHDRRTSHQGVVEVYFCSGAYRAPRAPKVYVQVPSSGDLHLGTKIIDELTFALPSLNVIQEAEALIDSPRNTQVRYFDHRLEGAAKSTADSLTKLLGVPVQVRHLGGYANAATRNQVEVWLGRSDARHVKPPPQVRGAS